MAECLVHRSGLSLKDGIITLSSSSITVYGGNGTNTVTYEYNGNGIVSAESNNTSIATVAVSGTTVTVTYVAPGSTTITISAPKTGKYKECSTTLSVTCSRTALTKPSLNTTSYTVTQGTTCTPGYNNYNSSLMTVSGTTSTTSAGTHTIVFSLKDTNRYCWSDGSTGNVNCSYTVATNIVFYLSVYTWLTYTFTVPSGRTWEQLGTINSAYNGSQYGQIRPGVNGVGSSTDQVYASPFNNGVNQGTYFDPAENHGSSSKWCAGSRLTTAGYVGDRNNRSYWIYKTSYPSHGTTYYCY